MEQSMAPRRGVEQPAADAAQPRPAEEADVSSFSIGALHRCLGTPGPDPSEDPIGHPVGQKGGRDSNSAVSPVPEGGSSGADSRVGDVSQLASPGSGVQADGPCMPEVLYPGEVYRLGRQVFGAYDHTPDYDCGLFIHVRILSGPGPDGAYECTTYGDDGRHLGPGGGWERRFEENGGCRFHATQLEPLAVAEHA